MKKIINIVEDEKDLNELVKSYLEKEGYIVNSYLTFDSAYAHIDDYCDLWILDIMLDDKSGFDLIEMIKSRNSNIPVIFMSARDKEFDRIIGLEKGSDDYITKPFSPKELVLRVNNIMRRVYKEDDRIEINGYADLLQPQLKGKIISADPANSSSAFQCLIGMLYGMGNGDPMSKEAWDFIDKFLQIKGSVAANSSSQVYNGVANGEYAVGLSYEDPCVELQAKGEKPVKVIYAAEGTVYPGESVQIIKGAPHMEAAKKFVDFVLSEESQRAVAAALNLRPLRAGIPVNEKMIPDSEIKQFETYSTAFVAEHKAEIVKMYLDHVEMNME